jgi:hypothetical protein
MNYIDNLAFRVYAKTLPESPEPITVDVAADYWPLYRAYAVLALAKGAAVTSEDVHDAWSAWQAGINTAHPSLIAFDELRPEIRALDAPYRDAIHAVAAELARP